tara:strand:+ start:28 stop:681 length:654 start_codon:yes stop_codon:yes gene_type:complete
MINSLEIIKEKTHEECSKLLLELISKQINESENISIGLSGGSTPQLFYELFAKKFYKYDNISLWTVDERHIETSENISNQNMINSIFNDTKLDIIKYVYDEDPHVSAENYTNKINEKIDKFNIAVLGVGDDGHIASLFPYSKALNSNKKGFVENEVNILTKWRITSTYKLLTDVEYLYLFVTGQNKKEVVQMIGKENELPVNKLIALRKKTVLLTDQ